MNGKKSSRPKRLLVVDDRQNELATLALLLTRNGYMVLTANDGPSALSDLPELMPDFALIDIGMPGMSGYELAQLIRGDRRFADTILIAVTAWTAENDRAAALRAGFDYHVPKPVDFDQLKAILDAH